jgi:hypothetical protein
VLTASYSIHLTEERRHNGQDASRMFPFQAREA